MNKIYIGGTEVANVGSGGGGDMMNYYDKNHIDASYGIIDASLKSFDASIKNNRNNIVDLIQSHMDLYESVTLLDVSALAFDASIRELASSGGGGGGGDMSNYATKSDISTFKPIVYTTKDDYDEDVSEGTIDPDSMYVITDLASSEDLATLVTVEDLSTYKSSIHNDLSTYIAEDLSTAKSNAISAIQSQQTTSVNAVSTKQSQAVSAVQSQQTTSVNAVNTAANNKIAEMPTFAVMTESDYNNITPNSSTIYFLT